MDKSELVFDGPQDAQWTIILAHGAGAGMDSKLMTAFAEGLAGRGLRVGRFELPYMSERRRSGRKRPPDRQPVLRQSWLEVIGACEPQRLVIGGKSLGGRVASLVADETGVAGLVCLGYPFHPSGKPEQLRIEHLKEIRTPTLIVQGERDALGNKDEVAGYELSKSIRIHWLPDGDHSFRPRKASGRTQQENLLAAIEAVTEFVSTLKLR